MFQLLAQSWVTANHASPLAAALITATDAVFSPGAVQLVCRQLRKGVCISLSVTGYSVLTVLFLWAFFCGALESAVSSLSLSHLCHLDSQFTSASVHSLRTQLHQHLFVYMNSGLHETTAYAAQVQRWEHNGFVALLPTHTYSQIGTLGAFGLMVYFVFLAGMLLPWGRGPQSQAVLV